MTFDDDETTEAHEMRITRCREQTCRERIVYLKTKTGKMMPVDADSCEAEDTVYDSARHVSHFTTCVAPGRFSGKNRKAVR